MQKPEFSLICDDTFYRIFSASIVAFFCIFISLDIGGSGELFYTDSPLRSQRAKPSLTIVFLFLALLYLRSGSKEAARVEFDELKISFRRGLDKYDLMLGCVDLIEPSFGFVRTFRVPFLSYERFLKLQEILKFLLLFAYVVGVFLTIKFGFAEAAIYAAAGIFAPVSSWSARTKHTIAIGQEIGVTSLQIVQAATAFTNKGKTLKLSLLSEILDSAGKPVYRHKPKSLEQVISAQTAKTVLGSLKA